MTLTYRIRAATATCALFGMAAPAWAGTFVVTTLDQPGFSQNIATAINDTDTVTGYSYNQNGASSATRSFVWRNGILTNKIKGEMQTISAASVAAGYYEPSAPFIGETYNVAKAKLTTLKAFDKKWFVVDPNGINTAGVLVGIAGTNGMGQHGFILDGKKATILDSPDAPPASSGAQAINDSGLVAGFWHSADGNNYVHSFLYQNGTYTSADVAGSIETGILFLDNAGDYAGRYTLTNGNWVGFAVIGGTMSTYVIKGSVKYNEARGVGPGGEVVGWWADASTTHGFLSIGGKVTSFNVPGAAGTFISGINALGSIYGYYVDRSGNLHAYVAQCPAGQTPCTQ
jgi:hypothetical protein